MTAALADVPGPTGLPFLGCARDFLARPLAFTAESRRDHGDLVHFRVGGAGVLMACRPSAVGEVLSTKADSFVKGRFYEQFAGVFGQGLVCVDGAAWQSQRVAAAPGFTPAVLSRALALADDEIQRRLGGWVEAGEVDLEREFMLVVLQVILRGLFGATVADDEARAVHDRILRLMARVERFMWYPAPWLVRLHKALDRSLKEDLAALEAFCGEMMRRSRGGDTLLSAMRAGVCPHSGRVYGERQVFEQMMLMILAAHETTATALSWGAAVVAHRPDVAAWLEGDAAVTAGDVTVPALKRPGRLSAFVDEVLRLYPPIWTLSREAREPVEVGGVALRPGETVMISPYVIHRDPVLWDRPDTFVADRFLDWRPAQNTYLPFGAGKRTCIGKPLALLETKLILARLLERTRIVPLTPMPVAAPMISLRPETGVKVRIEWRRS